VIGLDTNVLARYFIDEAGADDATVKQREAARTLLESGQGLYVPKTVALELEWVLRGYYRFSRDQVGLVFDALLNLPSLQLEDRAAIEQALAGLRAGLDFADALHHASCRACTAIASFDQRSFAKPARALNLQPRVITPS
jgi:predicted nucleic-acid-binding protein